MATISDGFVERTRRPKNIKGRGTTPDRSATFRRLEEIKKHCIDTNAEGWFSVGFWDNHSTACGVARGITRAGTDLAREGDQKCPKGRWEAAAEDPIEGKGTEIWVRFCGQ